MFNKKRNSKNEIYTYNYMNPEGDMRRPSDFGWLKWSLDFTKWTGLAGVVCYMWSFIIFMIHATNEEKYWFTRYEKKFGNREYALSQIYDEIGLRKMAIERQKKIYGLHAINENTMNEGQRRELEERRDEDLRWKQAGFSELEINQKRIRNQGFVPAFDDMMNEPIFKQDIGVDGCGYIIYDKKYGTYNVIIVSPARYIGNGKYAVDKMFRKAHLFDIEFRLPQMVDAERTRYNEFVNQSKNEKHSNAKSNSNVNHVREAMGMSNDVDENLDDDIF